MCTWCQTRLVECVAEKVALNDRLSGARAESDVLRRALEDARNNYDRNQLQKEHEAEVGDLVAAPFVRYRLLL